MSFNEKIVASNAQMGASLVGPIYDGGLWRINIGSQESDEYKWIGTNKDWMRGKTGGVGLVIKSDMECQRIISDSEDVYMSS